MKPRGNPSQSCPAAGVHELSRLASLVIKEAGADVLLVSVSVSNAEVSLLT